MDDDQQPDGRLSDDQQQQRDKPDQELLDGAESGVYLPEQAGEPVNAPPSAEHARVGQQSDDEQPDDTQSSNDEQPETPGQKIFAILFLPTLLAIVGGVVCVVGGQFAIATQNDHHHHRVPDGAVEVKPNWFVLFRLPWLQDWRLQFAIGAFIGAVCGIVFCLRFWAGKENEWTPGKNDGV